jgi:hypothetical protein
MKMHFETFFAYRVQKVKHLSQNVFSENIIPKENKVKWSWLSFWRKFFLLKSFVIFWQCSFEFFLRQGSRHWHNGIERSHKRGFFKKQKSQVNKWFFSPIVARIRSNVFFIDLFRLLNHFGPFSSKWYHFRRILKITFFVNKLSLWVIIKIKILES